MKLRRHIFAAVALAALAGLPTAAGAQSVDSAADGTAPLALVYRGPAGCEGCSEAAAEVLKTSAYRFQVQYVGPGERLQITPENLAKARVYVQPGGGDDDVSAAASIGEASLAAVRDYVRNGGTYLGICMGAYLAGNVGFRLVEADVSSEVGQPGSLVLDANETVTPVFWRGKKRWMYFQDGAALPKASGDGASSIIAWYPNKDIAAATYTFGNGRVGLVGPHPEADQAWYDDSGLMNPDGVKPDLAHDLISATLGQAGN